VADLLTHALVTVLAGRGRMEAVPFAWFLSGAVLPDFVSRAPSILMGRLVGPVLPLGDYGQAAFAFSSLHSPFGFGLVAAALVLALPQVLIHPLSRLRAWRLLMLGALLHIALDTLQIQYSMSPPLLFPISLWGPDIGFLGTEDSMWAWPVLIPLAAALEWRRRRRARATPSSGPPAIRSGSSGQRFQV
jgi:hypothetical protein